MLLDLDKELKDEDSIAHLSTPLAQNYPRPRSNIILTTKHLFVEEKSDDDNYDESYASNNSSMLKSIQEDLITEE